MRLRQIWTEVCSLEPKHRLTRLLRALETVTRLKHWFRKNLDPLFHDINVEARDCIGMLVKGHFILLTAHQLEKARQANVTLTYHTAALQRHSDSEALGWIRGLWQFEILWLHHVILKKERFTGATPKMVSHASNSADWRFSICPNLTHYSERISQVKRSSSMNGRLSTQSERDELLNPMATLDFVGGRLPIVVSGAVPVAITKWQN